MYLVVPQCEFIDIFWVMCIYGGEVGCFFKKLQWRHNGRYGVSNHQPHDRLLNRLFRRRPKKTSKLRVTGLCAGNSPATSEFPAQMASNAENVSIWWLHHEISSLLQLLLNWDDLFSWQCSCRKSELWGNFCTFKLLYSMFST